MTRFVVRRLLGSAAVLWAVSVLTFLLFQVIPDGDPAVRMAGQLATPETIAAIRRSWGFDQPIWRQYLTTMKKVLDGSVISYTQQLNVDHEIFLGLPATLSLAVGAMVFVVIISCAIGLASAALVGRRSDHVLTVLSLLAFSTPAYVLGSVLLYVFAFRLQLAPDNGYVPLTAHPVAWMQHLLLPWISLAIPISALSARVLRANLLGTMSEDFVRTARAKGLSNARVMTRHVFRNSLLPLLSVWGLEFAALMGGGAILIETVYNLHGVGQYAAQSIETLDVPPVLVVTMYAAFAVVLISAITDVVYAAVDPRIRSVAE